MHDNGFGQWTLSNGNHLARFVGRSNLLDISFSLPEGYSNYLFTDMVKGLGPQQKPLSDTDKAALKHATEEYFTLLRTRYPWLENANDFPKVRGFGRLLLSCKLNISLYLPLPSRPWTSSSFRVIFYLYGCAGDT